MPTSSRKPASVRFETALEIVGAEIPVCRVSSARDVGPRLRTTSKTARSFNSRRRVGCAFRVMATRFPPKRPAGGAGVAGVNSSRPSRLKAYIGTMAMKPNRGKVNIMIVALGQSQMILNKIVSPGSTIREPRPRAGVDRVPGTFGDDPHLLLADGRCV